MKNKSKLLWLLKFFRFKLYWKLISLPFVREKFEFFELAKILGKISLFLFDWLKFEEKFFEFFLFICEGLLWELDGFEFGEEGSRDKDPVHKKCLILF